MGQAGCIVRHAAQSVSYVLSHPTERVIVLVFFQTSRPVFKSVPDLLRELCIPIQISEDQLSDSGTQSDLNRTVAIQDAFHRYLYGPKMSKHRSIGSSFVHLYCIKMHSAIYSHCEILVRNQFQPLRAGLAKPLKSNT